MISCNSTTTTGSIQWTFDQIAGYAEFSNMFDQYKIGKIIMKVQLITNPDSAAYTNQYAQVNTAGVNLTNWYPKFWYIRDYDGGGSDTISQLKERTGVKCFVLQPNKIFKIALSPMVTVQTYRTSTTTGYSPKKLWIDMANGTDVPHYGLNYVVDSLGQDPNDSYPFNIRVEYQVYFACKGVR